MAEILQPDQVDRAVDALKAGQLVAFPTETVYGLGADATRAEAVNKVFSVKGRPTGHPLIVHVPDSEGLERFGSDISAHATTLAEAFWPGPLTIIVNRRVSAGGGSGRAGQGARGDDVVADETVGGKSTVGLRVPDHPVALELLRRFGTGVAAPSANNFGGVSPTTAQHVIDDLGSSVAFVLDGGPCAIGVESTIVDVSNGEPTLLRPGGISAVELQGALGTVIIDGRGEPSRASGMMVSHYSPAAKVVLLSATELQAQLRVEHSEADKLASGPIGVVAPRASALMAEVSSDSSTVSTDNVWDMPSQAGGYAARLYAVLRQADVAGVGTLVVVPPESGELLDAVVDRLQKAAANKPEVP